MSVKLFRVHQEYIFEKKEILLNIELDIVLHDNSVFHGIIKSITPETILAANLIRNKFTFAIEDITEIVYTK